MRLGLQLKRMRPVLEFNQSQWLKPCVKFYTQKRIEAEKNGEKDGKVLNRLINNAVYCKAMKNVRNGIDVRHVSNEKGNLKWTSQPSYMSQKIFDNVLAAIRKSTLTLKKPAYAGMCILDLSKMLTCNFHFDYIKNKYVKNSRGYYSLILIV